MQVTLIAGRALGRTCVGDEFDVREALKLADEQVKAPRDADAQLAVRARCSAV